MADHPKQSLNAGLGFSTTGFRVAHGFVIDRPIEIDDEVAGKITQRPFIGDSGQIGLHLAHSDGRVEYIYFNTSPDEDGTGGRDGGPGFNTFVYQGSSGSPAEDGSLNFYYLFDDEEGHDG